MVFQVTPKSILIVTVADDLHAAVIRQNILARHGSECYLLEVDRISSSYGLNWNISGSQRDATIVMPTGGSLDVALLDTIWWRRPRADQRLNDVTNHAHRDLISNDCRGALVGLLLTAFRGRWISEPRATEQAANKLWQLTVAKRCGFTIPKTLVSHVPREVRDFCLSQAKVIVKPVVGTREAMIFTQFVTERHLADDAAIKIAPAIYQEFVEGERHIRLNCFGHHSHAALIESTELDWRPNLQVPISEWNVPKGLHQKIRVTLDEMGLEMGIVDLKQRNDGELVWLEVNPQGQFLFLEGITSMPLADRFADYLVSA